MLKKIYVSLCLSVFLLFSVRAEDIAILVSDSESALMQKVMQDLRLPQNINCKYFSSGNIPTYKDSHKKYIKNADVIIVDIMIKPQVDYLKKFVDVKSKKVYAVRGSRDDEELKRLGIIFNQNIYEYYHNSSVKNLVNMIGITANIAFNLKLKVEPPIVIPRLGIAHYANDDFFTNTEKYKQFYKTEGFYKKDAPWIGISIYSAGIRGEQSGALFEVVKDFENAGFNVMTVFGWGEKPVNEFMIDKHGNANIDMLVAFNFKFKSALKPELKQALEKLNVPIINATQLYYSTIEEWEKSDMGYKSKAVSWCVAIPELSGLIEPTPLIGKVESIDTNRGMKIYKKAPIKSTINFLIKRAKKLTALQRKANKDKKIALFFYNHSQGKQNIGASYLNVFRSIKVIIKRLQKEGYTISDKEISEKEIKDLILRSGRNVGSWAPGELDKMLRDGKLFELPVADYAKWFKELPQIFQEKSIESWGLPKDNKIMVKDKKYIISGIQIGNLFLLPEPARGWGDDPMKLYHDPLVWPHHQYTAVYQWINKVFHADAMIHLGTHATYEWLPGKQSGLHPSDPPEVMVSDIPNIYPYIVDDIGEGVQAKRRGRGVIVDHLTPAVKKAGLYEEYATLYDMISTLEQSASIHSKVTETKEKEVIALIKKLGLDKDIAKENGHSKCQIHKHNNSENGELIHNVEHYLLEIKSNNMPFGLHTYGVSPKDDAFKSTVANIAEVNPELEIEEISANLAKCGMSELDALVAGLNGKFISSGEGNDPLRNPQAIPTGRNFYGFDPEMIPSKSAYKLGVIAAKELIAKKLKETGEYPNKVAVVIWACETFRSEGINESTILYLMGLKPIWDKKNRVKGVEVIPGKILGRPRIDVLITPSGLYRDLFPDFLKFLDRAVQKAAVQTDIENLIAQNSAKIANQLIKNGMDKEKAAKFAKVRIFSEKPGAYGTGVSHLAGMSGTWEKEEEVGKVFINHLGFAFSEDLWGVEVKDIYKEQLKDVDITLHSNSSNIYGVLDNDDQFQYLGGLSLAVKTVNGKAPMTMLSLQRTPGKIKTETIAKTVGRELRSRYFNPKWINAMKDEDYAGAGAISSGIEHLWGWQVTVNDSVSEEQWNEINEVYVKDKYKLGLKEFFDEASPWAYQSITGRMLESVRKKYWNASDEIQQNLAREYATSIINKGVACCDHTCNNPILNQMVMNLISIPGVMSPKLVTEFKVAIEKATKKELKQHIKERRDLQKRLQEGFKEKPKQQSDAKSADNAKNVKGYKMEKIKNSSDKTEMTSSGMEWIASLIVFALLAIFYLGMKKKK